MKLSKKLESKDKEVRKLAFEECFKIHDTSVVSAIEKLLLSFDEEEGFCLKLLQNEYILLFARPKKRAVGSLLSFLVRKKNLWPKPLKFLHEIGNERAIDKIHQLITEGKR